MCDGNDAYHPPGLCAAGMCNQAMKVDCTPYACSTTALGGCKTSCAGDGDCARRAKCTLAADAGAGVCGL
jgi:hypothetical protein